MITDGVSLDVFTPLLTTAYYEDGPYEAYKGFKVVEADIRAAHPEQCTPMQTEDSRFASASWMRIHAWSFTYLTLWCVLPLTPDGTATPLQYCTSLTMKPIAAIFDAIINTALFPIKLLVLIDRVGLIAVNAFLQHSTVPGALTASDVLPDVKKQGFYMLSSIMRVLILPISICANAISPKWYALGLAPSYKITRYKAFPVLNSIHYWRDHWTDEVLLDQNKVRYLRDRCGWQYITDEQFKALETRFPFPYFLSYLELAERDWDIQIQSHWIEGQAWQEDRNY